MTNLGLIYVVQQARRKLPVLIIVEELGNLRAFGDLGRIKIGAL
jgi:hypothetical protein